MKQISPATQKLIERYQGWAASRQTKPTVATVHADEVAAKVAAIYEKMKEVIEWKEQHLMRRTVIAKALKRRLIIKRNGQAIALPLILELIRGGHFPNDSIPESKVENTQQLINKYLFILQKAPKGNSKTGKLGDRKIEKQKSKLYNWLLDIAACEIEELLAPPQREEALIEYMTNLMKERIRIDEGTFVIKPISEKEKNTQIYIAVQRALFRLDKPIITYRLFKKKYTEWKHIQPQLLQAIAENIYSIWDQIENELEHPLADKFYKVCEKYDAPYLLLGDIISENPDSIQEKISQPTVLEKLIQQAYNKRVNTLKSRLGRAAVYATVSIFLSNIVSLIALEFPFAKYITGHFNWLAIGVDILGPTLLMAFLVISIKPPPSQNRTQVIIEVMKIVYSSQSKDIYHIKSRRKKGIILRFFIGILYGLSFCIPFGLIIWGLYIIHFPPLSHVIFIIFTSLIAFAGAKIRERAKELQVIETKEGLLQILLDFFSLPVIRLGQWLSRRWEKYNVLIVFLNALIDLPFQVFVEFLEQWRYFLKEKKESIH